jgi:cytochrome P450
LLPVCRYETTAAALNFTTYLLAKHPEIQRRLQEEIDAKFGDQTRLRNYRLVDLKILSSQKRGGYRGVSIDSFLLPTPLVIFF